MGDDDEIGDFVVDGGEDPTLKESVELNPFDVIITSRGSFSSEIAVKVEATNKEKKKPTPFFVVGFGEAKLNGDVELDVGNSGESKVRRRRGRSSGGGVGHCRRKIVRREGEGGAAAGWRKERGRGD